MSNFECHSWLQYEYKVLPLLAKRSQFSLVIHDLGGSISPQRLFLGIAGSFPLQSACPHSLWVPHSYRTRSAPDANLMAAGTTSARSMAAHVDARAATAAMAKRPKFTVAHLSTKVCTLSSFAMPASALSSVNETLARLRSFSSSFLLMGSPRRKV